MTSTSDAGRIDLRPWQRHYGAATRALIGTPDKASVNELIAEACRRWPKQIAFTTCMPNGMFGSLTFEQVDQQATKFANYLINVAGFKKGERLALQLPNCMAYPVAVFGAWKAGLVVVNTNPLYTPAEMVHQFHDSGAVGLVIVDMFTGKLPEVMARTGLRRIVVASVADFFPLVAGTVVKGVLKYWNRQVPRCPVDFVSFREALRLGGEHPGTVPCSLTQEDVAVLQYTGGTTGVSKGAVLTHGNLLANVAQICELAGPTIEDGRECILTALPLYHIFAFTVNLLAFFHKGGRNILIPSPRPISSLQRALENYPVTWITGVNTLFNALLNEEWFHETPPKSLKVGAAGGTMLHKAVAARWREVTGTPLIEGYGLTEASPVLTFNPFQGGLAKEESIGIPLPSTDVRIVDDDGRVLPAGERGELIARGPQIMRSY